MAVAGNGSLHFSLVVKCLTLCTAVTQGPHVSAYEPIFSGKCDVCLISACAIMFRLLQYGSSNATGEGGIRFVEAFVILWSGAGLVTLNTQLLKGKV